MGAIRMPSKQAGIHEGHAFLDNTQCNKIHQPPVSILSTGCFLPGLQSFILASALCEWRARTFPMAIFESAFWRIAGLGLPRCTITWGWGCLDVQRHVPSGFDGRPALSRSVEGPLLQSSLPSEESRLASRQPLNLCFVTAALGLGFNFRFSARAATWTQVPQVLMADQQFQGAFGMHIGTARRPQLALPLALKK